MVEGTYIDPYGEVCDSFYPFMFSSRAWNDRGEPEGVHRKEFVALRNALARFNKKPVATTRRDIAETGWKIWDITDMFLSADMIKSGIAFMLSSRMRSIG